MGRDLEKIFANEINKVGNVWKWLQERVIAGNFNGLRIGDYINTPIREGINVPSQTVKYRIGAIDPYYKCGNNLNIPKDHHIAMVPYTPVFAKGPKSYTNPNNGLTGYIQYTNSGNNNGTKEHPQPYLVSNLYDWENNDWLLALPKECQDSIMLFELNLETRYSTSGLLTNSTGYRYVPIGKIWSPSEIEVFGHICTSTGLPNIGQNIQFEIFKGSAYGPIAGGNESYWLRDVLGNNSKDACHVNYIGGCGFENGTLNKIAARAMPCFMIGKQTTTTPV